MIYYLAIFLIFLVNLVYLIVEGRKSYTDLALFFFDTLANFFCLTYYFSARTTTTTKKNRYNGHLSYNIRNCF